MKRTPLVLGGTVAGLIGVLLFRTTPSHTSFTTVPGTSAASGTSAGSAASASAKGGSTKKTSGKKTSGTKSAGATSKASAASSTRSATGAAVNYSWGVLSVKVTVSGKKITNIAIASLDDGGNPRSQMIDQQSVPLLEQEAMQAQSASIQSISGASYTSAGFVQSLQSALTTLGA